MKHLSKVSIGKIFHDRCKATLANNIFCLSHNTDTHAQYYLTNTAIYSESNFLSPGILIRNETWNVATMENLVQYRADISNLLFIFNVETTKAGFSLASFLAKCGKFSPNPIYHASLLKNLLLFL